MIKLRNYQQEIVDKILLKFKQGKKKLVIVSPTGSGKTVIFSYIAQAASTKGSQILILTHREELLSQTSGTLVEFGLKPNLIIAGVKSPTKCPLSVAMTNTLHNRLRDKEWLEWYKGINMIIIDEVHEQSMNWIFDNPLTKDKFIIGLTATPNRKGKQRQLSLDYQDMIVGKDVQELINDGYLVPDRYFSTAVDMDGVKTSKGDYNEDEMYQRYNKTELYSGVIDNWKKICPNTITIVFCCNIQHSINTCIAFNNAGIKAKFMVSSVMKPKIPDDVNNKADMAKYQIKCTEYDNYIEAYKLYSGDRKTIIDEWKRGEYKVLINAGIATTGFDHKPIETVIINRATTSENLLLQIIGRGSRISENKSYFYLLDFGENCSRLGYYRQQREYSLTHEEGKSGQGVAASKECPKCQSLIIASSMICKYCGYVFPKTVEQKVVELKEISYTSASKQLNSPKEIEAYAKLKGHHKNWAFRQIFIKFGTDGLKQYAKECGYAPNWVYTQINMYRAQGLVEHKK